MRDCPVAPGAARLEREVRPAPRRHLVHEAGGAAPEAYAADWRGHGEDAGDDAARGNRSLRARVGRVVGREEIDPTQRCQSASIIFLSTELSGAAATTSLPECSPIGRNSLEALVCGAGCMILAVIQAPFLPISRTTLYTAKFTV